MYYTRAHYSYTTARLQLNRVSINIDAAAVDQSVVGEFLHAQQALHHQAKPKHGYQRLGKVHCRLKSKLCVVFLLININHDHK